MLGLTRGWTIVIQMFALGTKIKKIWTYMDEFARKKDTETKTKKLRTYMDENNI
jgi:hypothetical protein